MRVIDLCIRHSSNGLVEILDVELADAWCALQLFPEAWSARDCISSSL